MKIASYHNERGDFIRFVKGEDASVLFEAWDRAYVTTLFSFEWRRTAKAIDYAIQAVGNRPDRVFVGGISASLMHEDYVGEPRWAGVRFIKGLLDGPPASSLGLSHDNFDFGADDLSGIPIEERVPDYGILDQIEYKYPVRDAYFGYASRGCVRKCSFCGVPKLEGAQREMPPLSQLVDGIRKAHGEKKDLVLMDNNITASSRFREVIAEIRDLGFTPGAKVTRSGEAPKARRVDFNQGVDARILAKSEMYLKEMATICVSPLRIAFDHLGLRKVYEVAIRMAADNGLKSLSNYMLYNFMDTPSDLHQRMKLNISLNVELGIRIWSFPMRYQPVTLKDRSHVGKHWNAYFLRSFQIMLQATHGVVSGNPEFFARAYGDDHDEFEQLLSLPHAFIFHRDHFETGNGRGIREEYEQMRRRLSASQQSELVSLLSLPVEKGVTKEQHFKRILNSSCKDRALARVIQFHQLDTKHKPDSAKVSLFPELNPDPVLPEDELVEDAGLYEPPEDNNRTFPELRVRQVI
ncbi:MAG: radical SAM protein [Gammaproteobacteria bacterium]|nr:radical SAM protein [Gammaproteobacteria bacterium]